MRISLCMIVRQEEKALERCLEGIADAVEEIVIVDMGSTDRTKEIARQFTDKIYDFPWVDDFAAARNFAFSKGTGEYLLWMDAADILPTLEGPYDVIFMDAAKGQYQAFLPHCLRLLPVGGLLIVDDVLQGGTIAQTRFSVPRRQRTIHKRLRNFLWEITHHDALETSIIPIGDGVALCYKKKEIIPETKTEGETKNAE